MPIDEKRQDFGGNIILRGEDIFEPLVAHFVSKDERARLKAEHDADPARNSRPFALWTAHFATCGGADSTK